MKLEDWVKKQVSYYTQLGHTTVSIMWEQYEEYIKGPVVLELGMGRPDLLEHLQVEGFDPYGADLEEICERIRGDHPQWADRILATDLETGFIEPWQGKFDTVIAIEVLEHLMNDYGLFAKANRYLRMGGHVIVGTQNYEGSLDWQYHVHHYHENTLSRMAQYSGFEVLRTWNHSPTGISIVGKKVEDV